MRTIWIVESFYNHVAVIVTTCRADGSLSTRDWIPRNTIPPSSCSNAIILWTGEGECWKRD